LTRLGHDARDRDRFDAQVKRQCSELTADGWRVKSDQQQMWIEYSPPIGVEREAGTKLHVSSSVRCAAEVLAACVPILRAHGVSFKHAANLGLLSHLSTGQGGRTQVGKFVTVYPADETIAALLAEELHLATKPFYGPLIPLEQPYKPTSLVYSRFGAFTQRWLQMPSGRIVPAVMTEAGLEIDTRGREQSQRTNRPKVLRDKYVRVSPMFQSPKGRTDLGFIDTEEDGDLVVIKEAFAHTMEDGAGRDARERLRNEAQCLASIERADIAPKFVDFWDEDQSSFLIYQPIGGPTLTSIMASLAAEGLRPPAQLTDSWTAELCRIVGTLHEHGYVSCDVKPPNVVVTADGFKLIDLELAGPPTTEPTGSMGTVGYCSPEQADPDCGRSIVDDVYGIGATLLSAAIASDASHLTNAELVARLEHSRAQDNSVFGVAARCLNPDPAMRYGSVQLIGSVAVPAPVHPPECADISPMDIAIEIGDRLLADAQSVDEKSTFWISDHRTLSGQLGRDLYAGSGGIALYLCALGRETRDSRYLSAAQNCANWMWENESTVTRREPMRGLYFGDSGHALLYLALHHTLREEKWLDRCEAVAASLDATCVRSPDLMTGLAGVGLLHLMRWHVTHSQQALNAAHRCAERLVSMRCPDRPIWTLPPDYDLLSGKEYLGFSHGSAGVGYFFAEHYLATGEPSSLQMCTEIADWLVALAAPALADRSGICWKAHETAEHSAGTNWCHGSPGMARFLATTYAATGDTAHAASAMKAARATAFGETWVGTTQCHGLAGNIEVLIDVAQHTGDHSLDPRVQVLAENLLAYRGVDGWPSDERSQRCPDLMVGEAGVGAAFLRMAAPTTGHLISCDAFRPAPSMMIYGDGDGGGGGGG
jgi:serine/threonine protein kinase